VQKGFSFFSFDDILKKVKKPITIYYKGDQK